MTDLPPLCLKSMTQVQLEKLVPKLVIKVTGRTSPLFGTVNSKPDWWPQSIDWINPNQLSLKYQNPCETLREIVRSCYQHSEKESLLDVDDQFTRSMPSSPLADNEMCVADQTASPPLCDISEDSNHSSQTSVGDDSNPPSNTARVREISMEITDCIEKSSENNDTKDERTRASAGTDVVVSDDDVMESDEQGKDTPLAAGVVPESQGNLSSHKSELAQGQSGQMSKSEVSLSISNKEQSDRKPIQKNNQLGQVSDTERSQCKQKEGTCNSGQFSKPDVAPPCQESKEDSDKTAIGSISPSILSEIDKHIMNSISSKIINFGQKKHKPSGSDLKYLGKNLLTEQSNKMGINEQNSTHTSQKPAPFRGKDVNNHELAENSSKTTGKQKSGKSNEPGSEMKTKTIGDKTKKTDSVQNSVDDDEVVWICFICAKEFNNQDDLMSHQDVCEDDSDFTDAPSSTTNTRMDQQTHKVTKPETAKTYDSIKNGSRVPVPALLRKVGTAMKTLPLGLPTKTRIFPTRKRKRHKDIYIPPPRDTYFESLGLVPTPKNEQMKTPLKAENFDCQIVDLTLDDDKSPQSQPMTPRTHLIMSQVSREEAVGARRRHLSFSQMTPPKLAKQLRSDSESSDSSLERDHAIRRNVPCKSVILAIPLTSLLGQRLKKHWQGDNKIPIIRNFEDYCQTSNLQYHEDPIEVQRKGKFTEKLRNRPPPQVTFRFTKKYINKWFHKFKFNKNDRREFYWNLKTGLESESRILLRKMKNCEVCLERMSKKNIRQWTHPRPKAQKYMSNLQLMRRNYNDQIRMSLLQGPRPGRPLQLIRSPLYLTAGSVQSRGRFNTPLPMFAQVQRQPTGPIPQFLVRNVPNGANTTQMELMPVVQKVYSHHPLLVPSQIRQKPFQNGLVQDDTVICLSSDDEDNTVATNPPPSQSVKRSQESGMCKGSTKPKIGPASFMRHQQSLQQRAQMLRKSSNPNQNSSSPVPMIVNMGKVDSASSRVFGKSLVKTPSLAGSHVNIASLLQKGQDIGTETDTLIVAGSDTIVAGVQSNPAISSEFTDIQIVNGNILDETSGSALQQPGSPTKSGNSQSDSEYMDFEVICIDSDDDS